MLRDALRQCFALIKSASLLGKSLLEGLEASKSDQVILADLPLQIFDRDLIECVDQSLVAVEESQCVGLVNQSLLIGRLVVRVP